MRLIDSEKLIERMNNAEENFKADNIEAISSEEGDPFVDGVLSGVFSIRKMAAQAPTVPAIPIDRIKQLREEMEKTESVELNGSDGFKTGFHGGYNHKRLGDLELIDNMIKEYEG